VSTCAGTDWDLADSEVALIASMVFVGVLVGALFWGPFADKYGRRLAFILGCSIIILFGFLSGVAPNFGVLLAFRALVGFGVGGSTIPFDLLAEFLPNSHRGRFLIYIEYFWTIGSMFVAGTAWALLSSAGWRVLVYVTAIPVTVSLIFSIFVLPESPRWLLEKGRIPEAEVIMREAIAYNGTTLSPSRASFRLKHVPVEHPDFSLVDFVKPGQCGLSVPLWTVWVAFGFAYYGIILFVTRIFDHTNDNDDDLNDDETCDFDYEEIFFSAFSELIGVLVASFIIDSYGRVPTQTILYFLSGVGALMMGLLSAHGSSDAAVAVFGVVARCSIMGASCATWVCTPELFPTHLRATGHSIASSVSRLGAFSAPFIVDNHSFSEFSVGLVLAIVSIVAAGAAFTLPETKGKDLDAVVRERESEQREGGAVKNAIIMESEDPPPPLCQGGGDINIAVTRASS
jgi:MFS family permease